MELDHHAKRRRLPNANAKSEHNAGNHADTVSDAIVSADYHRVEHADDHAAQLGLVQQRHGPHRQQLLESVYHELLRRASNLLQRDLGLLRDRTSDWSGRHSASDGATAYQQPDLPDRIPWLR